LTFRWLALAAFVVCGGVSCQQLLGIHTGQATVGDAGAMDGADDKAEAAATTGNAGGGGTNSDGAAGVSGTPGRGGAGGEAGAAGSSGHGAGTGGAAGAPGSPNGGAAGGTAAGGATSGGGSSGATGGASGTAGMSAAGAGGAPAVIISIDFVGGRASDDGSTRVAAPMMAAAEVAGVRPAARWNAAHTAMGTLAGLVESTGATTSASIAWSSPADSTTTGEFTNSFTDTPGDTRMMNGFLNPATSSAPAVITVSGLPATLTSRGYDVYVYTYGNIIAANTRSHGYAIGSKMVSVFQLGPTPATFPGYSEASDGGYGNYVIFRGLGDATFTLTATPGTGTVTRAPVNGIQIVSSSGL
jgi:hypothetical protein